MGRIYACSFPGCVEYLPRRGECDYHSEADIPSWSARFKMDISARQVRVMAARRLFDEGSTVAEVAAALEVAADTVRGYLRETG